MKINPLVLVLLLSLILSTALYAGQAIEISGFGVPLIENAKPVPGEDKQTANFRLATYAVDKPLADVVQFYESFLKENDFLILGPEEENGFSASVKKDNTMFTLKIYSENKKTIIQFIW